MDAWVGEGQQQSLVSQRPEHGPTPWASPGNPGHQKAEVPGLGVAPSCGLGGIGGGVFWGLLVPTCPGEPEQARGSCSWGQGLGVAAGGVTPGGLAEEAGLEAGLGRLAGGGDAGDCSPSALAALLARGPRGAVVDAAGRRRKSGSSRSSLLSSPRWSSARLL